MVVCSCCGGGGGGASVDAVRSMCIGPLFAAGYSSCVLWTAPGSSDADSQPESVLLAQYGKREVRIIQASYGWHSPRRVGLQPPHPRGSPGVVNTRGQQLGMLIKRVTREEQVGRATAVWFVCLFGRATNKEVEEKDKQVKQGPSKLTALYHGPGGV